jgi:phosphoribosylanthranilate isomerase
MDQALHIKVKICGITRLEDAAIAIDAGADAIGLNFVPSSKRRISVETARAIVAQVKGKIEVVAVVADLSVEQLKALREATGISWLQLHGDEPAETLRVLTDAFKAIRIGSAEDVRRARLFPGPSILVDAKIGDERGGTGSTFDWTLVKGLASERRLMLAGGLTPENVGDAVLTVGPWGVDVASGVESSPGVKDRDRVVAFVRAAREAAERRSVLSEAAEAKHA